MAQHSERVNEILDAVLLIGRATENGTDGKGHVEGIPGDTPPCEHGALPGFSSGITDADEVVIIRRRSRAVSVGSLPSPSGEQAGDRTIWTSQGLTLRLRGKVLEITGSEAVDGILLDAGAAGPGTLVVRKFDKAHADINMLAWLTALSTLIGVALPTDFGVCDASTTKVKAG